MTYHSKIRKANKANEILLDVTLSLDEDEFFIYDISHYLPHWEGRDRSRYLDRVAFTFKGKDYTVHIINLDGTLVRKTALNLATAWIAQDKRIKYYVMD